MPIIRHVAVVFRIAAGPRIGFGHLVRCRAIARALGVEPRVSIRGTAATRRAGARLGLRVLDGGPACSTVKPRTSSSWTTLGRAARPWVRAARRRGVPVAQPPRCRPGAARRRPRHRRQRADAPDPATPTRLFGPRYAVLDPALARGARPAPDRRPHPRGRGRRRARLRSGAARWWRNWRAERPEPTSASRPDSRPARRPSLPAGRWTGSRTAGGRPGPARSWRLSPAASPPTRRVRSACPSWPSRSSLRSSRPCARWRGAAVVDGGRLGRGRRRTSRRRSGRPPAGGSGAAATPGGSRSPAGRRAWRRARGGRHPVAGAAGRGPWLSHARFSSTSTTRSIRSSAS